MAVFKCKMCGGALEVAENATTVSCDYCGSQQTLPKLNDDKISRLYDRAGHFRRNNEFDKASAIYEEILNEDNTDAEAYWSLVLCGYGIEYVEDPATRRRIPTVNRAQFTSVFDDDNYKSALQYADIGQKSIYEAEAKEINEIQKGILAISQKEEPFDVFICYKETDENGRRTRDSIIAGDLYQELTEEGFKVFFSRFTLEGKLGTAYEPYIFAALNSVKVMVVLGTRPEYFNAVWVKNEWSRYLALVKQSKGKKMLVPAYRDMDPYDLPEEFSHLQAQDMSKLGFMQDLVRGIAKIVPLKKSQPQFTYSEPAPAPAVTEDSSQRYNVKLLATNRKLDAIKVFRELNGCGLKEAKDFIEVNRTPIIATAVSYEEAERIRNHFLRSNLDVELIPVRHQASDPISTPKASGGDINTILRRAEIFLESKDWNNANIYCEKALDIDPENSQAYIYKLMAAQKVSKEEQLGTLDMPFAQTQQYKDAVRFADEETAARLIGYNKQINERMEKIAAARRKAEEEKKEREREQAERARIQAARESVQRRLSGLLEKKSKLENQLFQIEQEEQKRTKTNKFLRKLCVFNILVMIVSAVCLYSIVSTANENDIWIFILLFGLFFVISCIIAVKSGRAGVCAAIIFLYGTPGIILTFVVLKKGVKKPKTQTGTEPPENLKHRLDFTNADIEEARKALLRININNQ